MIPPPLTEGEKTKADNITVYYIWYEDRFHFGEDRESYAVSIWLSQEEAEAELIKYDRPVGPGQDGYFIEGPFKLSNERRPEIVRAVLAHIAKNNNGPVMMNKH
jgi:hypothetical protein